MKKNIFVVSIKRKNGIHFVQRNEVLVILAFF